MTPQKIDNLESYEALLGSFFSKGSVSNNYMLPTEVSTLINNGRLYACHDEMNCFLLVRKDAGVSRLYYMLNDLTSQFNIEVDDALVAEILFRDSEGEPTTEIEFLKTSGFETNIRLDQFSGFIPDITDAELVYAKSEKDAMTSVALFNATFDKYSGDFVSPEMAGLLLKNNSLLCAYDCMGNLQGSLQINISGRNAWVAHLVVDNGYRGKGVANKLMDMFVTDAKAHGCKRLMLWVRHDNETAISLYKKYGLNYANKSTISLIKK